MSDSNIESSREYFSPKKAQLFAMNCYNFKTKFEEFVVCNFSAFGPTIKVWRIVINVNRGFDGSRVNMMLKKFPLHKKRSKNNDFGDNRIGAAVLELPFQKSERNIFFYFIPRKVECWLKDGFLWSKCLFELLF